MTTPANELPVTVDYTNRDYYSLREAMISRIKSNVNVPGSGVEWSGTDPADFGVALVEAFAYMGDVLNYYIDRVANESYISTATQRQSIINLAKSYGYSPSGYRAASTEVTFYNDTDTAIEVLEGTQVSGYVTYNDVEEEVIFTVLVDATVPAAVDDLPGESVPVTAVHGELISSRVENSSLYGEQIGTSSGAPDQTFILSENQVVENSIEVYVEVGDGSSYTLWKQVAHLADSKPTDAVYTTEIDADNFVYISFGDGISGAIPTPNSIIRANYYVGGGEIGNITAGVLDTIRKVPTGTPEVDVTVTNSSTAYGGSEPETNSSIRYNAPKALSTLNRAVTLEDYSRLALSVGSVGKAAAIADTKTSVTLYVSPQQSAASTDLYPGYTEAVVDGGVLTSDWYTMRDNVKDYLSTKTQIGVSVTVSPPTYVPVNLYAQFTTLPQYSADQVKANLMAAVVTKFSYSYLIFEDVISPEEVEFQLRQVEGVYSIKVISMYRTGETGRNILIAAPGELFVFEEGNIDISPAATIATLDSLSSNLGTLVPSFAPDHSNYNLPVPNGTASIELTPANPTAAISINGVAVVTGTAHSVLTPVGTTIVSVQVIAQDGTTTQSYRITVTRAA